MKKFLLSLLSVGAVVCAVLGVSGCSLTGGSDDSGNQGGVGGGTVDGNHSHEFDYSYWEFDKDNHWHPATCAHDVRADEAEHNLDLHGKCECGFYDHDKDFNGHILTLVPEKPFTCEEDGYLAHYTCSHCNGIFQDNYGMMPLQPDMYIIPAHHEPELKEQVQPDCTNDGLREHFECTVCLKWFDDWYCQNEITDHDALTVPAGHFSTYEYAEVPVSCFANGKRAYVHCYICNKNFTDNTFATEIAEEELIIPTTGHNATEHARTEPNCYQAGTELYYTCNVCTGWFFDKECTQEIQDRESVNLAATGHVFEEVAAKQESCTEDGNRQYFTCDKCGEWYYNNDLYAPYPIADHNEVKIPAYGHSMQEIYDLASTCTEEGKVAHYECWQCEKWYVDRAGNEEITDRNAYVLPAAGHSKSGLQADYQYHFYTCLNCDAVFDEEAHSFGADYCSTCQTSPFTKDMQFELTENKESYRVTEILNPLSVTETVVPRYYLGKPVTEIDNIVMRYNTASVTIPGSVTRIYGGGFYNDNLKAVYAEDLNSWLQINFDGDSPRDVNPLTAAHNLYFGGKLVEGVLDIPEGTERIGEGVFNGLYNVTTLNIPQSVTHVGAYAFSNCENLVNLSVANPETQIGENAFNWCPLQDAKLPGAALTEIIVRHLVSLKVTSGDIPELLFPGEIAIGSKLKNLVVYPDVNSIGRAAFQGIKTLEYVNFKDGAQLVIGPQAFNGCNYIQTLYFGENSVTEIQYNAFDSAAFGFYNDVMSYVTEMTLPEGLKTLGSGAFSRLRRVTKVNLPSTLTEIGDNAFSYCQYLSEVVIAKGTKKIGASAFGNCNSLTDVTIPDSVTAIGDYAFYGCTKLKNIGLPESVTAWGIGTFMDCERLTGLNFPAGVTVLPEKLFYNCYNLQMGEIPDGITEIGANALYGCYRILSLTIPQSVKTIESNAFDTSMLFEVYNLSAATVPSYIKQVHTSLNEPSTLTHTADGFILYKKEASGLDYNYLVGYEGNESVWTTPDKSAAGLSDTESYRIYSYAFYKDMRVTSLTLSADVAEVGTKAFYACENLESVTYVEKGGTGNIADSAFENCVNLKTAKLCSNSLFNNVLAGCTNLETVYLRCANGIGKQAFYNCVNLKTINYYYSSLPGNLGTDWDANAGISTESGKYSVNYNVTF